MSRDTSTFSAAHDSSHGSSGSQSQNIPLFFVMLLSISAVSRLPASNPANGRPPSKQICCIFQHIQIFHNSISPQNGNRKVMQAVVQRKFRENQFETDPEKIEKYKGEYALELNDLMVCSSPILGRLKVLTPYSKCFYLKSMYFFAFYISILNPVFRVNKLHDQQEAKDAATVHTQASSKKQKKKTFSYSTDD
jgi:hypothetical protein